MRLLSPRPLHLFLILLLFLSGALRAAEPFFKKGDVIALVGGEDMVVASEYGYLELLLVRALPDYRLRFRNLAWEGDTVFEQRRDLNFPTWEEQLDKIVATVVICQFGQMESLGGKEKLPEFIAAYEKLIERFSGGGKRRVVVVGPVPFDVRPSTYRQVPQLNNSAIIQYGAAASGVASRLNVQSISPATSMIGRWSHGLAEDRHARDGAHLTEGEHRELAWLVSRVLEPKAAELNRLLGTGLDRADNTELHRLLTFIIAKNRLWFDYWRPQNWAFLAGDRTAQPSSRDHLDPSQRWFPPEREAFLPLIEAREKAIDALAAQLARP